jgi:hypothetical protein
MKRDPDLFLACPFIGITRMNSVPVLMLRNCPRCDGTLGLSMTKVIEMFPLVEVAL